MKRKYVIAGAGARGLFMYAKRLCKEYADFAELKGIYDINSKRAAEFVKRSGCDYPVYDDFDKMIEKTKPDSVIVTCVDAFHHEYAVKAMKAGCNVIIEKPMTTDAEKCNEIIKTQKETGKDVTVTFNCRYMPFSVRVKELLNSGITGDIVSVHFEWLLDMVHGPSYFNRWNSEMKYSGGLQLHKCSHHFDLANWWVSDEPKKVFAFAKRRFFGPGKSQKRGEFCHACPYASQCEYFVDLSKTEYKKEMYLNCMDIDNYSPDKCVYRDEIDIHDILGVTVEYEKGAVMSYALNAHSPYEGYKIAISGTKGRIEAENTHCRYNDKKVRNIKIYDYGKKGEERIHEIPEFKGAHGGGDDRLLDTLFKGVKEDPIGQAAGIREGAMSIGIGIGINESVRLNRPVLIKELFPALYE